MGYDSSVSWLHTSGLVAVDRLTTSSCTQSGHQYMWSMTVDDASYPSTRVPTEVPAFLVRALARLVFPSRS